MTIILCQRFHEFFILQIAKFLDSPVSEHTITIHFYGCGGLTQNLLPHCAKILSPRNYPI
jgi:hypothetical protein